VKQNLSVKTKLSRSIVPTRMRLQCDGGLLVRVKLTLSQTDKIYRWPLTKQNLYTSKSNSENCKLYYLTEQDVFSVRVFTVIFILEKILKNFVEKKHLPSF